MTTEELLDAVDVSPAAEAPRRPHVTAEDYTRMYAQSIEDPDGFWGVHGCRLEWMKPFSRVRDVDFSLGGVSINWFAD
ncbi:acetyl-coenzyme A synthetase N-terminal domain-containing protein, partial [Roseobacter sinensis]